MISNVTRPPDVDPKVLWTSIAELASRMLSFDRLLIAALLLGLTRAQLYSRIEKHGL
jgi:hypothetical protein